MKRIPQHEAKILLQWVLGTESLLMAAEPTLNQRRRYRRAVRLRQRGFPLQHITGEAGFREFTLRVGPGVFIPRPETEMLVEYALAEPNISQAVDLCTGSGAIALALESAGMTVDAVELSARAAQFARVNLQGTSVRLHVGNALDYVGGPYDLVVSNPPYVSRAVIADVLFDPIDALYGGGEDGLVTPRGLVVKAISLLRPGGIVLMEHEEGQGEQLCQLALAAGFVSAETLHDLTGRPRFLRAQR